jgi:IPTL-CTERM motif
MRRYFNSLFGLSLCVFAVCVVAGYAGSARAQQCFLEICKSAPGAPSDLGFTINFAGEEIKPFSVELFDSEDCFVESFISGGTILVTEDPTQGWPLEDIVCETSDDFSYNGILRGVAVLCSATSEASTTCTFVNGLQTSNIPTLSEWGMIAAAAGLGMIGVFFAVRRRRAALNS